MGFLRGVRTSPRLRTTLIVYSAGASLLASAAGGVFSKPLTAGDFLTFAWAAGALAFMPLWLFIRGKTEVRTLTAASDGISTQIGRLSGNIPWSQVKVVTDTGSHVLVARTNGNAFIIPSRAFEGPDQKVQFLREAEAWRRTAAQTRACPV
jgi:hypothetical protein